MTIFQRKLWIALLIMALLTPLGLLLPKTFNAGEAWGEWGPDKLLQLIGYVPEGLKKWAGLWKAPVPDYNFGGEGASMTIEVISYVVSGLLGIAACTLVAFVVSRFIRKHGK